MNDQHPVELLQQLLRFDTTNPPGNEAACVTYIRDMLAEAGLATTLLARTPGRPNLIARLPGRGDAPPLLLQGHVDVVPVTNQHWRFPPFAAQIADGYVWGRGTLDMKGGVAMQVAALLRAASEQRPPPGDIVLAVLCDEEAGSVDGARFLVEEHRELFAGVRDALGEFGGFSLVFAGRRFYPIMLAEKQVCPVRVTLRGPGGHGASIMRGGAAAKLGRVLQTLDRRRLPVHITPIARLMIESLLTALPLPARALVGQVLNPALTGKVLDLLGAQGALLEPLVHNTVNATIVRGGGPNMNVIPSAITIDLDGRLLPGHAPAELLEELSTLLGPDTELEVLGYEPGPPVSGTRLFGMLAGILREADPQGHPMPLLLNGVTDARFFATLGIQTYGFLPMQLPPDFHFSATIHAADERIPVGAVAFGADAIYKALQRYSEEIF